MLQFFPIFINVIMPVFAIVVLGALLGKKLELNARTLTRISYYVLVPCFVFRAISQAHVPLDDALRMILFVVCAHILAVVAAVLYGKITRRSKEMIAAFVMVASFGNVGNFGLAVITFHLGDIAVTNATIYFVTLSTAGFIFCDGAAGWARGGSKGAVLKVLKTPSVLAPIPAILISYWDIQVPLMLTRSVGLLADAMIPMMLFCLGLQLQEQGRVHLNKDVFTGAAMRLVMVSFLALLIAPLFGLDDLARTTGILQSAMPAGVLVAIIARENNIAPEFATSVVVVTTLMSLFSLTMFMMFL